MNFKQLELPGCFLIELNVFEDKRGSFIKTFNSDIIKSAPFKHFNIDEEFITSSRKHVIRGLHFQIPPFDHNKIVYCLSGRITDVLVDLRKNSKSYGQNLKIDLMGSDNKCVYIPKGFAHGFVSRSDNSTMIYKLDKLYHPDYDKGIKWDSCNINWDENSPILSERDLSFPEFNKFQSPF